MAHLTDLGFTLLQLGEAVDNKRVRTQTHPEFPNLTIANYSEEVQFKNSWDKITLACRGLIFDSVTGEVIARPWEKFFNMGQRDNRIAGDAPVEVSDKLDGSLGILYRRPDDKFAIATRGSFASEQALHATALLGDKYKYIFDYQTGIGGDPSYFSKMVDEWTFLFEIIYPDNRIVCDYGDMDDLVLLGAVHKQRGHYIGPNTAAALLIWDGPVAETFMANTFVEALSLPDRKGKEGYIIRSGNKIVKLKQSDYVELHRIVTNLSPRTIWGMLKDGKSAKDICMEIPDEFHKYVTDIADELIGQHSAIKFEAFMEFADARREVWEGVEGTDVSRKRWAEAINKRKHRKLLFSMLDNRPIDVQVWDMVKPRGDVKTLVEDEG